MNQAASAERAYIARIKWVNPTGRYAVTNVKGVGEVTFSYDPALGVWSEGDVPIPKTKVVISDLRSMDGGWRAFKARYFRPEDEGKAT